MVTKRYNHGKPSLGKTYLCYFFDFLPGGARGLGGDGQSEHEHTKRWSRSVAAADAYVFVTPEYNYGTSPALLNALDYPVVEWGCKPAGVVSYGGVPGGLRGG